MRVILITALWVSCLATGISAQSAEGPQSAGKHCPQESFVTLTVPNLSQVISAFDHWMETICAPPYLSVQYQDGLAEISRELGFNPLRLESYPYLGVDVSKDGGIFFHLTRSGNDRHELILGAIVPLLDFDKFKRTLELIIDSRRPIVWNPVPQISGVLQPSIESPDGARLDEVAMLLGQIGDYAIVTGGEDDEALFESMKFALGSQKGVLEDPTVTKGIGSLGPRLAYLTVRPKVALDAYLANNRRENARSQDFEEGSLPLEQTVSDEEAKFSRRETAKREKAFSTSVARLGDPWVFSMGSDKKQVTFDAWTESEEFAQWLSPKVKSTHFNNMISEHPLALLRAIFNPSKIADFLTSVPEALRNDVGLDDAHDVLIGIEQELSVNVKEVWIQSGGAIQACLGSLDDQTLRQLTEFIATEGEDVGLSFQIFQNLDLSVSVEFSNTLELLKFIANSLSALEEFDVSVETLEGGRAWMFGPKDFEGSPKLGGATIVETTLIIGSVKGLELALARRNRQNTSPFHAEEIASALASKTASFGFLDLGGIHSIFDHVNVGKEFKAIADSWGLFKIGVFSTEVTSNEVKVTAKLQLK